MSRRPSLGIVRATIVPVLVGKQILFEPFICGRSGYDPSQASESSRKLTLGYPRSKFFSGSFQVPTVPFFAKDVTPAEENNDNGLPLILYRSMMTSKVVQVDGMLTKFLRPHQREGVQFLFDCLSGRQKYPNDRKGFGCLLADDMGLGKTLQSVAIAWTLLCHEDLISQDEDNKNETKEQKGDSVKSNNRFISKCLILTPASLVQNWSNEFTKWLNGRFKHTAVIETGKDKVTSKIDGFKYDRESKALILSYEGFRINFKRICNEKIDFVICDEAHRLKNMDTQLAVLVGSLKAKRRLFISGTPLQNELSEFFALSSLCNPDLFGPPSQFRKEYANPIEAGTEADASPQVKEKAQRALTELTAITNMFVLKRSNAILAKLLPPKFILNVFCRPSKIQLKLYAELICDPAFRTRMLSDEQKVSKTKKNLDSISTEDDDSDKLSKDVLSLIQLLMKLSTHPILIPSSCIGGSENSAANRAWTLLQSKLSDDESFQELNLSATNFLVSENRQANQSDRSTRSSVIPLKTNSKSFFKPKNFSPSTSPSISINSGSASLDILNYSGKFVILFELLKHFRSCGKKDRVVVISNFTQTLDLISKICSLKNYPMLRLDGTTGLKKRQQLVNEFNDPSTGAFCLLLSSKAGGCGINLIGGNRLIMVDPDWNPANDNQALARIWRDGQKKSCYVYRLFSSGTVDEIIFQRQLSKTKLSEMVVQDSESSSNAQMKANENSEILKNLFNFDERSAADSVTHTNLKCSECSKNKFKKQLDKQNFDESDLNTWSHYKTMNSSSDSVFEDAFPLNNIALDLNTNMIIGCKIEHQIENENKEDENEEDENKEDANGEDEEESTKGISDCEYESNCESD